MTNDQKSIENWDRKWNAVHMKTMKNTYDDDKMQTAQYYHKLKSIYLLLTIDISKYYGKNEEKKYDNPMWHASSHSSKIKKKPFSKFTQNSE